MIQTLPREFFLGEDVVSISKQLLGKCIVTQIDGIRTAARIVETEAYQGPEDEGSHAYQWKRTTKNEHMYLEGGYSYVYICYGIHDMFNIVTNTTDIPHAVLIRAVEPLEGVEQMMERRGIKTKARNLTGGPGLLCQALGIRKHHSGCCLYHTDSLIRIEDRGVEVSEKEIIASKRVGFSIRGYWAEKQWRFRIKDNPWSSPAT